MNFLNRHKLQCFWAFIYYIYYIYYFISLKRKQFFSLVPRYYRLWLLQTLNLPPTVSVITEVDCNYRLLKSDWLPVINYRLISHLLNHHHATHEYTYPN